LSDPAVTAETAGVIRPAHADALKHSPDIERAAGEPALDTHGRPLGSGC
jgi:hypothetical protein